VHSARPVDEMILKIAQQPAGQNSGEKPFWLLCGLCKVTRSAME